MLFYTPPALNNPRHSAQRQPLHHAAPGPARAAAADDDDDKRRAIAGANWDGENVKRRVEAAGYDSFIDTLTDLLIGRVTAKPCQ